MFRSAFLVSSWPSTVCEQGKTEIDEKGKEGKKQKEERRKKKSKAAGVPRERGQLYQRDGGEKKVGSPKVASGR